MNETKVLLQAYYETLYDRLEARKPLISTTIGEILAEEVARRRPEGFDAEKYAAYREACLAFLDERMEAYNPTGLQYLFDREVAKGAFEHDFLELYFVHSSVGDGKGSFGYHFL